MKAMRPLPAREPLLPGESLSSLVRRTAEAMGYEKLARIRSLLKEAGDLPAHFSQLQPGPVWDRLGHLLKQPAEQIKLASVHHYANRFILVPHNEPLADWCDSKTALRFFSFGRAPVCPRCFDEDEHSYERLRWSLRPLPVCMQHNSRLISTCPKCTQPLRPSRLQANVCQCGFNIRHAKTRSLTDLELRLFRSAARWFDGGNLPLNGMNACATFWWLERLAAAVTKTPSWRKRFVVGDANAASCEDGASSWLAAICTLDSWPDGLFDFLDEFQKVTKHRTTATGVTRSFGLLLREAKHLEDLGYSEPADTLRRYLTECFTEGQLTSKIRLFKEPQHQPLLRERLWVTLTESDKQLHFRKGGSAALIERGILDGTIQTSQSGHRTVGLVSRDSIKQLAEELKTACSISEVTQQLAVGRSRVLQLIKSNELPRSVWTAGGWRIPRSSIDRLLHVVGECPVKAPNKNWITVREATRRFGPTGLNFVRLIQLIKSGQVSAKRIPTRKAFQGLVVSAADLAQAHLVIRRMHDDERGYPLNRVARSLISGRPMKESTVKKWIEMGLLQANREGRALVVTSNEVDRFRSSYCLFGDAAKILNIHKTTLLRWVSEGELTPVYGPQVTPGTGFNVFRREDVVHLKEFIQSHHRKWRACRSRE